MERPVEKLEHFWHILLFEFNRGTKAEEAARNICACMGTMPSERALQEIVFFSKKDRSDISDIQEDLRGFMKIVLTH